MISLADGQGQILELRLNKLHEDVDKVRLLRDVVGEGAFFAHALQTLEEDRPKSGLLLQRENAFLLVLEVEHEYLKRKANSIS